MRSEDLKLIRSNIEYTVDSNNCFNCTSHKTDKFGYPRISFNRKNTTMHRYIYTILKGKIDKGLVVRHKCDNPKCINIDHLELGTIQDNVNDRCVRGRTSKAPRTNGEVNGMHKLKEYQVRQILKLRGKLSQSEIANKFGVSQVNISCIFTGKSWSFTGGVNCKSTVF